MKQVSVVRKRPVQIDLRVVALVFVNLAFVIAVWRAYNLGLALTGSVLAAIATAAGIGLPFYLWELLYQYPTANRTQTQLSIAGMLADIGLGVLYGYWDYSIMAGYTLPVSDTLLISVLALSGHALAAFAWYLVDDQVANRRRLNRERAEAAYFAGVQSVMRQALEVRASTTDDLRDLVSQYGVDAVRAMLAQAGYDPDDALAPIVGTGTRQLPPVRPMRQYAADTPAIKAIPPDDEPDFPQPPSQ